MPPHAVQGEQKNAAQLGLLVQPLAPAGVVRCWHATARDAVAMEQWPPAWLAHVLECACPCARASQAEYQPSDLLCPTNLSWAPFQQVERVLDQVWQCGWQRSDGLASLLEGQTLTQAVLRLEPHPDSLFISLIPSSSLPTPAW